MQNNQTSHRTGGQPPPLNQPTLLGASQTFSLNNNKWALNV